MSWNNFQDHKRKAEMNLDPPNVHILDSGDNGASSAYVDVKGLVQSPMFSHFFTCFTLLHQVLLMPLLGRKSKCGTVTYHLLPTHYKQAKGRR